MCLSDLKKWRLLSNENCNAVQRYNPNMLRSVQKAGTCFVSGGSLFRKGGMSMNKNKISIVDYNFYTFMFFLAFTYLYRRYYMAPADTLGIWGVGIEIVIALVLRRLMSRTHRNFTSVMIVSLLPQIIWEVLLYSKHMISVRIMAICSLAGVLILSIAITCYYSYRMPIIRKYKGVLLGWFSKYLCAVLCLFLLLTAVYGKVIRINNVTDYSKQIVDDYSCNYGLI